MKVRPVFASLSLCHLAVILLIGHCLANDSNIFMKHKKDPSPSKRKIVFQPKQTPLRPVPTTNNHYFHGIYSNSQGEQYIWLDGKLLFSQAPNYPLMCDIRQTNCAGLAIQTEADEFLASTGLQANHWVAEQ